MSRSALYAAALLVTGWYSCCDAQPAPPLPEDADAEPASKASSPEELPPLRIALVDMAEIFKDSEAFNARRAVLQGQVIAADEKAKEMALQMKEIAQSARDFAPGTDDYEMAQKKLTTFAHEFEVFKANAKRKYGRSEAEMYKQTYLDIVRIIETISRERSITLVMKFDREPIDGATSGQAIMKKMNRSIVFVDDSYDITDDVIRRINEEFESESENEL